MKKTIVIFLALILAGPFALKAEPQDDLRGKVVRISGSVNGMGVVLLYKAGYCLMFEDIDDLQRQTIDLKNQEYRVDILADSREAYLQMLSDGLTPAEIVARAKPAQACSAHTDLFEIAKSARKKRIGAAIPILILGVIASVCGIYALSYGEGYSLFGEGHSFMGISTDKLGSGTLACGLIASGVGVLLLSSKSSAERSYDRYLKEKNAADKNNKLALNVGLDRHGFSLGVNYYF